MNGFVISYLSQNQIKEFVIKSNYIAFNKLDVLDINDYEINFETYEKFYKFGNDKIDKESFYNFTDFGNYEYAFTPIWSYSDKLNRFLFIEPHQNKILFTYKS